MCLKYAKCWSIPCSSVTKVEKCVACPVLALRNMLKDIQNSSDQPLYQIYTKKGLVPFIASNARSFLRTCIAALGLNPNHYTFHSFRRSGASLAFKI